MTSDHPKLTFFYKTDLGNEPKIERNYVRPIATTGSKRAARQAGQIPATVVTMTARKNAIAEIERLITKTWPSSLILLRDSK